MTDTKTAASQPAESDETTKVVQQLSEADRLRIALALRREALKETYRSERTPSQNKDHFRFYYDGLRGALTEAPPT